MTEAVQTTAHTQAIREGNDLWRANNFRDALIHYKAIRPFFYEAGPIYLRQYFCNLGIMYCELGRYEEAISNYESALAIEQTSEDEDSDIAAVNANLANVYLFLNRPDEAHAYLCQPEEYFRRAGDLKRVGEVMETRARVFLSQCRIDEAICAANEAYDLLRWYSDDEAKMRAHRTLGRCLEAKQAERF
jgi:tetratricopeptide (TPR) repeat protein